MKEKLKSAKNKILYIDTSDREEITVMITDGVSSFAEVRTPSLNLLDNVNRVLELASKHQDVKKEDLTGVCVFVGPGSFTGLRAGISFANGLAFGFKIPIYETREKRLVDLSNPKKAAVPFYGSPPKITKPKKR